MTDWNFIQVENVGDESRLINCLGQPPIKFINPRPQNKCCQVFASNYGGGLVDGDVVGIKVEVLPAAHLYLGTQSSTKVYKSEGRGGCTQETYGKVHEGALAIICPDPVVPFAGSIYRQKQVWEVHPDGNLILFDWIQPGRSENGEVFAYQKLTVELTLSHFGRGPFLKERFELEPKKQNPFRKGRFGNFQTYFSVYFIGKKAKMLIESLQENMLSMNSSPSDTVSENSATNLWVSLSACENEGVMLKALGGERRDVVPLQEIIFSALKEKAWLGFNPWDRRW